MPAPTAPPRIQLGPIPFLQLRARARLRQKEGRSDEWRPNPCRGCDGAPGGCALCDHTGQGPQGAFMSIDTDVLGFGGAAGGGKTASAAVKAALRWGHTRGFSGILFRRTRPEAVDSLWKEIVEHYPRIVPGVHITSNNLVARFPAGGQVRIGYLEGPDDRIRYQGGGYQYVAFDEASHFAEADVRYLFTRQRSRTGIRSQLVLCSNPGGVGHEWLFRWFAPWLDPEFPHPARSREVRWFLDGHDTNGAAVFVWTIDGRLVTELDPGARSITFIPALLEDNQALVRNDPNYEQRLRGVDEVTYQRLRFGNWLIRPPGGGLVYSFDRSRHIRSFAARMGASNLRDACLRALQSGWRCTTGWDHGIDARREACSIILWSDHDQELWVVGFYLNARTTTPTEDAIAVRRLLDARGIPIRAVVQSTGDIGRLGKAAEGQESGAARTINQELSTVRGVNGAPILGFPITVPRKEPGSVEKGTQLLTMIFGSDGAFLDDSASELATALESWTGGEAYKDPVDSLRYPARPILEGWLHRRPGASGVVSG